MRWLDTTTGAFLSEDPLVQATNNAFGYAEGNPITQIDPLGLFSWDDTFGWAKNTEFRDSMSNISTIAGGISTGLAIASLIPTPASPVLLALSGVAGIVSATAGAVSTIGTCWSEVETRQSLSGCGWGIATTALSIAPFLPQLGKLHKLQRSLLHKEKILDQGELDS